jgi:ankyrin repeat protein
MNKQEKLNTGLIKAAEEGDLATIKLLIKQGADIHTKSDYALYWSAVNGHLEVVKYLIIDSNMVIDKDTIEYLKENKEINLSEILNIINVRDLQQQLENNLNKPIINGRIKIKL